MAQHGGPLGLIQTEAGPEAPLWCTESGYRQRGIRYLAHPGFRKFDYRNSFLTNCLLRPGLASRARNGDRDKSSIAGPQQAVNSEIALRLARGAFPTRDNTRPSLK